MRHSSGQIRHGLGQHDTSEALHINFISVHSVVDHARCNMHTIDKRPDLATHSTRSNMSQGFFRSSSTILGPEKDLLSMQT
jgi:hypothetical protein